jgi:hypothetical protein
MPKACIGFETTGNCLIFPKASSMKPGDWILRNRNSTGLKNAIGSLLSTFVVKGTVMSFLALLILSTVIAAADICRALAGNQRLFNSVGFIARYHSPYKSDPLVEKERSRLERSDLDAYRNERQRWHQLQAEEKGRLVSMHSKKSPKPHSTL